MTFPLHVRWPRPLMGLLLVVALSVGACGEDGSSPPPSDTTATAPTSDGRIPLGRVLRTDDRFSTLTATLDSTELDSILMADGPYTLFAPPNSAFEQLPDGTLPVLLNDRPDQLRTILSRHIVEGRVPAATLSSPVRLRTLAGDSLRVEPTDSTVRVESARLLDADVEGTNGLIHVVDRVFPPPESPPN